MTQTLLGTDRVLSTCPCGRQFTGTGTTCSEGCTYIHVTLPAIDRGLPYHLDYDTGRFALSYEPTNADLGFGPGSDDEQDALQWFLTSGRIIA